MPIISLGQEPSKNYGYGDKKTVLRIEAKQTYRLSLVGFPSEDGKLLTDQPPLFAEESTLYLDGLGYVVYSKETAATFDKKPSNRYTTVVVRWPLHGELGQEDVDMNAVKQGKFEVCYLNFNKKQYQTLMTYQQRRFKFDKNDLLVYKTDTDITFDKQPDSVFDALLSKAESDPSAKVAIDRITREVIEMTTEEGLANAARKNMTLEQIQKYFSKSKADSIQPRRPSAAPTQAKSLSDSVKKYVVDDDEIPF